MACSLQDWNLDPNTVEKDISLEKTRELAPFDPCFPSILPPGVQSVPVLTYEDEREGTSGPLMWAAINAEYVDAKGNRAMELQQRSGRSASGSPGYNSKELVRRLIAWQVYGDWDKVEATEPGVEWRDSTYQEEYPTYNAVEILFPDDLRGSLVTWRQGNVMYELYSLFPLTTTLDVARSVSDCEAGDSW